MQRRKFLKQVTTTTLAGALLGRASSLGAETALSGNTALSGKTALSASQSPLDEASWQHQFASALQQKPWLLAFRSVTAENFSADARITGKLPQDLSGTLYRNGPAEHEIGDYRYQHWFDGNGMLQAYHIGPSGVRHQGRMIATTKYLAERDAGRALYPGFASLPPDPRPLTSPDQVNVANISVLAHHDKLYALWEAGSAWEMDPATLATRGKLTLSPETEGLPFSAHPRVEPEGTLWNFGYASGAGRLVLWHVDPRGKLVKAATVPCNPMGMPHDFMVTEKHLVILVPPLHFEPEGATTFLAAHKWHPERPTQALVVDKNDFASYQWYELPAQWIFHYGNAWEDAQGVIRFDGPRAANPTAMLQSFHDVMRGADPAPSTSRHAAFRIDTRRGQASEELMFDEHLDSEFPTIDPRVSGRRNQRLVMLTARDSSPHGLLNTVSVFDEPSGSLDSYRYPDHLIPEEHLFVPKPGSAPETDGWVLGSTLNYANATMELNVFNVRAMADGPLAVAKVPYALPLGLHGKFV